MIICTAKIKYFATEQSRAMKNVLFTIMYSKRVLWKMKWATVNHSKSQSAPAGDAVHLVELEVYYELLQNQTWNLDKYCSQVDLLKSSYMWKASSWPIKRLTSSIRTKPDHLSLCRANRNWDGLVGMSYYTRLTNTQ